MTESNAIYCLEREYRCGGVTSAKTESPRIRMPLGLADSVDSDIDWKRSSIMESPKVSSTESFDRNLRFSVRQLNDSEKLDMEDTRKQYKTELFINEESATQILEKIDAIVCLTISQSRRRSNDDLADLTYNLAVAWGDAVTFILGWSWIILESIDGEQTLSIVSQDNGLVCPVYVMFSQLLKDPKSNPPSTIYRMMLNNYFISSSGSLKLIV